MGIRSTTRRLRRTSERLVSLRDELRVIDEQRSQLADEADDTELRSMVSDSPMARMEAREAAGHAEAHARARAKVLAEIARLEAQQDQLLDRLNAG
jgi:hypothetical protein